MSSRIAQLRIQMDWTQIQLARQLHVNLKTIRNWENGDSYPSAPNILALCELFSVSTDYLFGIDDRPVICLNSLSEEDRNRLSAMIQVYINLSVKQNNRDSDKT